MSTITHFMVPADDIKRAKKFYAELFGWEINRLPGPMDYYEIKTVSTKGGVGLGGGMAKRQRPQEAIVNYIDVPSIDEFLKKTEKFGGKVITPKVPVPGQGYVAVCLDTENNAFGLWETDKKAQMTMCQSCGMPLDDKSTSKLDKRHCIHCQNQETGELASKEQVREGSINAFVKFMGKTKEEAEKAVDEMMPKLPRWQKNSEK